MEAWQHRLLLSTLSSIKLAPPRLLLARHLIILTTMAGARDDQQHLMATVLDCDDEKTMMTKKKTRHPTYFQMIALAVAAAMKQGRCRRSGCSRQAIAKFIWDKFGPVLPARMMFKRILSRKLKQLTREDQVPRPLLMRVSRASYKLSPILMKRSRTVLNRLQIKLNGLNTNVESISAAAPAPVVSQHQYPPASHYIGYNEDSGATTSLDNSFTVLANYVVGYNDSSSATTSLDNPSAMPCVMASLHQPDTPHETPITSSMCVSPPGSDISTNPRSSICSSHRRKLSKKRQLQQLLITMDMNVTSSPPSVSKRFRRRLRYSDRWLLRPINFSSNHLVQ